MTLTPETGLVGRRLGQYRIVELLGLGGMGEVYKAVDERLDRTVAIKVLPPSFISNPERVRRFEREARVASSINHPHIAAIYDVGEDAGVHFIAMEYVEGETLPAWLSRSGLALAEVLVVLEQVADALARAHDAGVLHRDVKPANVMVSKDGYAKLLDFGLAKVSGESGPYSDSDIRERLQTRSGAVMGTMAYMSPEQARGQRIDRRSDIFSFGAVLFEAVAGIPPFAGDSGIEAVSGVLRDDPLPRLKERPGIPRELVRIITKALDKDSARRYQFIDDLVVDLRAVRRALEAGEPDAYESTGWGSRPWPFLALGVSSGCALAALYFGLGARQADPRPPLVEAGVLIRPLTFDVGLHRDPSISPDGRLVSYASDRGGSFDIVVQQVATGKPLRITEDADDEVQPSFSPDGQTLVFGTSRGAIRTVPALGGPARTLVEAGADHPAWSPDGRRICYRSRGGLAIVERTGGAPRTILEGSRFWVQGRAAWSPDGRVLVVPCQEGGRAVLIRVPAAGGAPVPVGGESQALGLPAWSADGLWILGSRGPIGDLAGEIWALPVKRDADAAGEPVRILGSVLNFIAPSLSGDRKKLVFEVQDVEARVGRVPIAGGPAAEPVLLQPAARVLEAQVSHSGGALAAVTDRSGRTQLWKMRADGGSLTPLREDEGEDRHPSWSPDDERIAFCHRAGGSRRIAVTSAGGGPLAFLTGSDIAADYPCWAPDGRSVFFVAADSRGYSLRVVSSAGGDERTLSSSIRPLGRASPEPQGRWVAIEVQTEDGEPGIALVPTNGGDVRLILRGSAPLWLGGDRLAFVRRSSRGGWDLWRATLDRDGDPVAEVQTTRLRRGEAVAADRGLSTDGRFIYFAHLTYAADHVWLAEAP